MAPIPLRPAASADPAPPWAIARWIPASAATSLEALRGRVVVLHAFQLHCPGCARHGVPQVVRLHRALDPAEVAVVGLHSVFEHPDRAGDEALTTFLAEQGVTFPVGVDQHLPGRWLPETLRAYALDGTPSLVLIDRAGRLRGKVLGTPSDDALRAAIAHLTADPAAPRGG